jgi:hypothetical protein
MTTFSQRLFLFLLVFWIHKKKDYFIAVSSFPVPDGHLLVHHGERRAFPWPRSSSAGRFRKRPFIVVALLASSSSRETSSTSSTSTAASDNSSNDFISNKQRLLDLIAQTPRNAPTPPSWTAEILQAVQTVEAECPSFQDDAATFLDKLRGTWDLLWTSQDPSSREAQRGPLFSYINPLENQSYSNNPASSSSTSSSTTSTSTGRANPLLPRGIQDRLEAAGILPRGSNSNDRGSLLLNPTSTQTISLSKQQVRNIVTFNRGSETTRPTTLTVTIDFQVPPSNTPSPFSNNLPQPARPPRRINVTFQSCRVVVPPLRLDFVIPLQSPLGLVKPVRGWLRTTYLDHDFRITRGHKGSVFILARPRTTTTTTTTTDAVAAAGSLFNNTSSSS